MPDQKKITSRMVEPLKTGELLVKEGLIRLDDIEMVLAIQEKRQESLSLKKTRLFGMILCDLNLITPMDNYFVLYKYNKLMTIQSALISRHILTENSVINAKEEARQQAIPFISYLLKNKRVSIIGIQRLVFDLFHIPFRPISDLVFNETDREKLVSVLDKYRSRENGVIPLVLKGNTLLFGITDPENILFVRQLDDHFPQYRFKLLFIPFSGFLWFYDLVYGQSKTPSLPGDDTMDISLLLNFKIEIKNPDQEDQSVRTLYLRYEQLHHLIGNPKRDNRQKEFRKFISQNHKIISQKYKSLGIEFSLKRENKNATVVAFPKI